MRTLLALSLIVASSAVYGQPSCPQPQNNEIILGTFNVYKLGSVADEYDDLSKANRAIPQRIRNLAHIIAAGSFDVLALQEVTSGDKGRAALTDLVTALKADHNLDYSFILSDYIGRGLMAEAIAFLYKPSNATPTPLNDAGVLTQNIEIPGRDLVKTSWLAGDFDFTLVSAHLAWGNETDRDAGYQKIDAIFTTPTPSEFSQDPDIIVVGDFNRFGKNFDSVKELEFDGTFRVPNIEIFDPGFNTIAEAEDVSLEGKGIPDDNPQWLSTTVSGNTMVYDMIMFSPDVGEEYSAGASIGNFSTDFGVLHFDEVGGCGYLPGIEGFSPNATKEAASDHRPLWMRFKLNGAQLDN